MKAEVDEKIADTVEKAKEEKADATEIAAEKKAEATDIDIVEEEKLSLPK